MAKNTVTLKKLKDGAKFKLSKRSTGAVYELNLKKKGLAYSSSVSSKRTYRYELSTVVYPV